MTPLDAALLRPLLAQVGWVFFLYAWLSAARLWAIRAGRARFATFEFGRDEPPAVARITRNLSNQFELPVVFYAAIILLMQRQATTATDVTLAWVFVAGRVLHTGVQTLTGNVLLRGLVFSINLGACVLLVAHLALLATG